MTTVTKIIIGVLVLGAVGGAWYHYAVSPKKEIRSGTSATPALEGKKMAFADFIKNDKGSYKCTVHRTVQNIDTTGTMYIANKMIRGEFSNNYQGQNVEVKFIIRDGYGYTWTTGIPNMSGGYKIKIPVDPDGKETGEVMYSYVDSVGDYTCENWTVDTAMFTVPTNMTFQAMN